MRCENISNQKFGRLTALEPVGAIGSDRNMWWLCKCDCGAETKVPAHHLKNGNTSSCGCLAKEKHCCVKTHGVRKHPLYDVWWLIKERCENPNRQGYQNYGGRGIKLCKEWHDVATFIEWGNNHGYETGLEIDRIDVNGDYEPNNCRFVSHKENANNRRNNRYITYNGKTQTLKQWSEELGISYSTLQGRINRGYSDDEIVTIPKGKRRISN